MKTTARFLLSSNPIKLAEALKAYTRTATVEAEYGEDVVTGSISTLAHHGPRQSNLCPCLYRNSPLGEIIEAVGLSHVDLDTLGGCAATIGCKPEADGFWKLAAFVDTHGPHKIAQSGAVPGYVRCLYAFWAWSQNHRVFPLRDGSVADVTDEVLEGIETITRILAGDERLLIEGDQLKADEAALNARSFLGRRGDVVIRKADVFVNHLYICPDGHVGKMVVALNTKTNGITVSLADSTPGVNCRTIVQNVWGDKAGGHDGIAGSPRDQQMTEADLELAVQAALVALEKAPQTA